MDGESGNSRKIRGKYKQMLKIWIKAIPSIQFKKILKLSLDRRPVQPFKNRKWFCRYERHQIMKELENLCLLHCTKKKFTIKDFFSKCDQIRRKLRIWSHLLKKSLKENFFYCAVLYVTKWNKEYYYCQ